MKGTSHINKKCNTFKGKIFNKMLIKAKVVKLYNEYNTKAFDFFFKKSSRSFVTMTKTLKFISEMFKFSNHTHKTPDISFSYYAKCTTVLINT